MLEGGRITEEVNKAKKERKGGGGAERKKDKTVFFIRFFLTMQRFQRVRDNLLPKLV